jgi:hypothetical protein
MRANLPVNSTCLTLASAPPIWRSANPPHHCARKPCKSRATTAYSATSAINSHSRSLPVKPRRKSKDSLAAHRACTPHLNRIDAWQATAAAARGQIFAIMREWQDKALRAVSV